MISLFPKIAAPSCSSIRSRFSEYLDSRLTGREMQRVDKHLKTCSRCSEAFDGEQRMLRTLASLGPVSGAAREPEDLPGELEPRRGTQNPQQIPRQITVAQEVVLQIF